MGTDKFDRQLDIFQIKLNQKQKEQFEKYYKLLAEWNRVMNLTGITERGEVYEKHFVDSLALVNSVDIHEVQTVIDVGTGAGFPGIPLKISFPHLKVTLLDSLNKRIKFLDKVITELGLQDITTIHGRAEDFAKRKEYREQFDLCVSRAVANLSTLSEYCIPYIRVGGIFLSYKSATADEETEQAKKAISILGARIGKREKYTLPECDIHRSFIKIIKEKPTPAKYPRKAGIPAKEPL